MLPSDCAKATMNTVRTISTWATGHQSEVKGFEESLVSSLNSCLQHAKIKSEKIKGCNKYQSGHMIQYNSIVTH